MGARLNWIMHFGLPPRFSPDVRVVQMDIDAGGDRHERARPRSRWSATPRRSRASSTRYLKENPWQYPAETTWRTGIQRKIDENVASTAPMLADDCVADGLLPRPARRSATCCRATPSSSAEGASTMDIGRTGDAPTSCRATASTPAPGARWASAWPQAIAAQLAHPDKNVVAIEGDSAFGFSGMEVEVACRYSLPITFIVINNNGIGGGPTELDPDARHCRQRYCPTLTTRR